MTKQTDSYRQIRRDRPVLEIEITPAMIEAGRSEFVAWFERDENSQALSEMPSSASVDALLAASFSAMASLMPESVIN